MDPDRNNLETFINITVQFYITQVYYNIYMYYSMGRYSEEKMDHSISIP